MLALLSPAKSLNYSSRIPDTASTDIRFPKQTKELARAAAKLKAADLKRIMHISDALAELNAGRYSDFFDQPERPAIYAFSGDVYVGFEAGPLPPDSIDFAQDHVRILSGLYALLRPLASLRPYPLAVGPRWAPSANHPSGSW